MNVDLYMHGVCCFSGVVASVDEAILWANCTMPCFDGITAGLADSTARKLIAKFQHGVWTRAQDRH